MMTTRKWLGYLGLTPFIVASLAMVLPISIMALPALDIFTTYSAVIASFLAGSLWLSGGEQAEHKQVNRQQLIISNVIALLAFAALLMPKVIAISTLLLVFIALYYLDFVRHGGKAQTQGDSESYLRLRLHLTTVVCLLHLFVLAKLQGVL